MRFYEVKWPVFRNWLSRANFSGKNFNRLLQHFINKTCAQIDGKYPQKLSKPYKGLVKFCEGTLTNHCAMVDLLAVIAK